MTKRENFVATLLFQAADRPPLAPGGGRESTLAAWHAQGLPATVRDYAEYAYRLEGGRLPWPPPDAHFPVNERMMPLFEEKVIEERPDSRVVQDWKGNICEIGKEFSPLYLRNAIDFVTRRWIKCPVESRADWELMQRRYDSAEASRLAPDPLELGRGLAGRVVPLVIHSATSAN